MFYRTMPRAGSGPWQMSGQPMVNERREDWDQRGAAVNWHLGPDWHVSRAQNMIIMLWECHSCQNIQNQERRELCYSGVSNSNISASESGFWKDRINNGCVMMVTRHIVCIPGPWPLACVVTGHQATGNHAGHFPSLATVLRPKRLRDDKYYPAHATTRYHDIRT